MTGFAKAAVAAVLLGGLSAPALAQTGNQVTTTSTTTIIRPVTIGENAPLAFGRIVRPTVGSGPSTITISTASDTPTATGTAVILGSGQSRASYSISGEGGQQVSVSFGAPTFELTQSGSDPILVTLARDPVGTITLGGALGAGATAPLHVGGSFDLADETDTGAYTGQFTVTVAYQ